MVMIEKNEALEPQENEVPATATDSTTNDVAVAANPEDEEDTDDE